MSTTPSWLRALQNILGGASKPRRAAGATGGMQIESLEVRRVLSAAGIAPLEAIFSQDVFSNEQAPVVRGASGESQADGFLIGFINSLRGQLTEAFGSSDNAAPLKEVAANGVVEEVGLDGSWLDASVQFEPPAQVAVAEISKRGSAINVDVVLDWSDLPPQVSFVSTSETDYQIIVQGLASSSFSQKDSAAVERLIYENVIDVLQSVQPARPVQISFRSPIGFRNDQFLAERNNSGRLNHAVEGKSNDGGLADAVIPSLPSVQENANSTVVTGRVQPADLVEEVFSNAAPSALDQLSLAVETPFALSDGVALVVPVEEAHRSFAETPPERLSENDRVPLWRMQLVEARSEATSKRVVGAVARRSLNWLRTGILAATENGTLTIPADDSFRIALVRQVSTYAIEASRLQSNEWTEWTDWLTGPSNPLLRNSDGATAPAQGFMTAGVDVVPTSVSGHLSQRQLQGSPASTFAKTRKFRSLDRKVANPESLRFFEIVEQQSTLLPQSGSIPRELKYVANPRGPPEYGRDANVPFADMDAPDDLLARLRYSIAPRGPSLVTEKMQSPEFQFFSGPRVSPSQHCLAV